MKFKKNEFGYYGSNSEEIIKELIAERLDLKDILPNNLKVWEYDEILRAKPDFFDVLVATGEIKKFKKKGILYLFDSDVADKAKAYFFERGGVNWLRTLEELCIFSGYKEHIENYSELRPLFIERFHAICEKEEKINKYGKDKVSLEEIIRNDLELLLEMDISVFGDGVLYNLIEGLRGLGWRKMEVPVDKQHLIPSVLEVLEKEREEIANIKEAEGKKRRRNLLNSPKKVNYENCSLLELEYYEAKHVDEFAIFFSDHPYAFKPKPDFYSLFITTDNDEHGSAEIYLTNFNLPNASGRSYSQDVRRILNEYEDEIQDALEGVICNTPAELFIGKFVNVISGKSRAHFNLKYIRKILKLTNIRSEVMIEAIIDLLCNGMSQNEVCDKHGVKPANLSRAAKKIMNTDTIVTDLSELRD